MRSDPRLKSDIRVKFNIRFEFFYLLKTFLLFTPYWPYGHSVSTAQIFIGNQSHVYSNFEEEDVQAVCREVAAVLGHKQVPPCLVERPGFE